MLLASHCILERSSAVIKFANASVIFASFLEKKIRSMNLEVIWVICSGGDWPQPQLFSALLKQVNEDCKAINAAFCIAILR